MNILSEPLVNYVILFSFLIYIFFSESWEYRDLQFILKNCDSQFIQNRAALVYITIVQL